MFLSFFQKLDDIISYLFASSANEVKLLKNIFGNKKVVLIDVGTNEGSYTDLIYKNFQIKKIYCFEPISKLCNKLKKKYPPNILNIYNFPLSNKSKTRNFYEYSISSTSSLYKQNDLYKSLKKIKNVNKIKTYSFDKIFNKNEKIDICKIDVQGEDFNVLKGMKKNLIKKNIKVLKIELSLVKFYENTRENFYDIIFFLKKLDYELISISKLKFKNEKIMFLDVYFALKK